jgi:hypothetical protein
MFMILFYFKTKEYLSFGMQMAKIGWGGHAAKENLWLINMCIV